MKLMWDIWYRSKGAKEHMPKKSFAGKNFGSIFWDAMRLVFMMNTTNLAFFIRGYSIRLRKSSLRPMGAVEASTKWMRLRCSSWGTSSMG